MARLSSQDSEAPEPSWPTRRHPNSDAPSSRCRAAGRTGRSSPSPRTSPAPGHAELVGVHVVEIDWTLPLDADIAGHDEEAQRVLDIAEATAEAAHYQLETVLLQARDVGAAIVDEATEREADLIICGLPFRRRFGGEFAVGPHHPVHPEERALRGLGHPRSDARGASMKAVIVGCGRVGAGLADELDRAGWQVLILDLTSAAFDRLPVDVRRHRPPRRRHRRGHPAPGRRRGRRPVPRPDRGRQPQRHGRAAGQSRRSAPAGRSPRSTTPSAPRRTPTWASRPCAART